MVKYNPSAPISWVVGKEGSKRYNYRRKEMDSKRKDLQLTADGQIKDRMTASQRNFGKTVNWRALASFLA
jgi:hypothetical protein